MTYQEKLKDPRWQRKRLEIMQRDKFTCRGCRSATKTLHVHHKAYKNGCEPWEYDDDDLITLCHECHTERHFKVPGLRIYLAGRIYPGCWRVPIVGDSQGRIAIGSDEPELPIRERAIFGEHDYCGPYFVSCDHGCSHMREQETDRADIPIGPDLGTAHGRTSNCCTSNLDQRVGRELAFSDALLGIKACNFFFAWIEDTECYGTLFEIGYAHALRKPIYIAVKGEPDPYKQGPLPPDLWFALRSARKITQHDNASAALEEMINFHQNTP